MMRTRMMAAAAGLACMSGMAIGQLQNAGFETLDNTGLFGPAGRTSVTSASKPASRKPAPPALAWAGNFTGPFNVSGIFQSIPASAQQIVEASAFFLNPSSDPMQGDNFVVLNIEFYNAANQMIAVKEMRAVDANTPVGVWRQVTNSAVAPCDTASARIVPLFVQGAQLASGSAMVDTTAMAPNGTSTEFSVQNPGFEVEGYIPGWVTFGNAFREWQFTRTGTGAIKFFGNFNAPFNVSGAFQVFCVQPGQSYTASAWAGTPLGDNVNDGDFAVLNMEVFDSNNQPLNVYPDPNNPAALVNFTTVQAVAPDATPGVYSQVINTTVMPINAAKVRLVLLHVQPDPAIGGGSTWFDDITFGATPTVGCDDIDFNNNDVFPEDQDVVDFFNVLAGADCPECNDIDFNNNGVFPEDQDVIDFFNVLAGGECP